MMTIYLLEGGWNSQNTLIYPITNTTQISSRKYTVREWFTLDKVQMQIFSHIDNRLVGPFYVYYKDNIKWSRELLPGGKKKI